MSSPSRGSTREGRSPTGSTERRNRSAPGGQCIMTRFRPSQIESRHDKRHAAPKCRRRRYMDLAEKRRLFARRRKRALGIPREGLPDRSPSGGHLPSDRARCGLHRTQDGPYRSADGGRAGARKLPGRLQVWSITCIRRARRTVYAGTRLSACAKRRRRHHVATVPT